MENDPNKKLSKGKRILKKAIRRNSKSNSSSQHSVIEQGISDSRSKSFENKHTPLETKQSASLTISNEKNEKTDRGGNVQKITHKTQQERPPPKTNDNSGKTRLFKVDEEIKDESLEADTSAVKKEVKLSLPTNGTRERSGLDSRKNNLKRKLEDDCGAGTSGASTGTSDNDADDKDPSKDKKKKNRCAVCRKKVGLTGFECRCGGLFCAVHRYSDKHECSFDYRELGAQEIRRNNPVVVSQKIHKI